MKKLQMCQVQPSHDLNMKCNWSFKNTINGKTQNIAIKGNTIMLMNEYGSFPQERANWQNVITKESQWAGLSKNNFKVFYISSRKGNQT